ncbi:MAG: hypothetical protein JNN07_02835 [Verrucomicrobiales bacterium]|nr:hypothetical protein [Verrucomicrobiales bacterium]
MIENDESLRSTATNAAGEEAEGSIWKIRYSLLWVASGGVLTGSIIFAALFQGGSSLPFSAVVGGLPAGLVLSWVWFKQTHPPAHDTDLLALWISGPGFGPNPPTKDLE